VDLPGNTLVLRIDSWRGAPDLFPNVLTALVTAMSIALVSVLVLLGKDMRRRLRAEHDLADALAFRKAMEDSLVTGLRARDLQGRITYVNPAFCQMVGFSPRNCWATARPRPTGRPSWPTNTSSARPCAWPAARAAARGVRIGLHAQGRFTLSGADHRGAADQRAWRADRLDERISWTSASSAAWRNCRAPARTACRPRRAWPRWARWRRCSATSSTSRWPPSASYATGSHEPAAGTAPTAMRRPGDRACAALPSRPSARAR
jgi:PAS domain-containing protein